MIEGIRETYEAERGETGLLERRLLKWRATLTYLTIGLFLTIIAATAIGPVYILSLIHI